MGKRARRKGIRLSRAAKRERAEILADFAESDIGPISTKELERSEWALEQMGLIRRNERGEIIEFNGTPVRRPGVGP